MFVIDNHRYDLVDGCTGSVAASRPVTTGHSGIQSVAPERPTLHMSGKVVRSLAAVALYHRFIGGAVLLPVGRHQLQLRLHPHHRLG